MRQRRQSLAKILLLQEQLNRLNALKLAALEHRRATLEEAQRATIEAIDRDALADGILVASATQRLRNVDTQIAKVEAERVTQSQRAQEQAKRVKLAERLVEQVEVKYRMQKERADLADLIERSLGKNGASSA